MGSARLLQMKLASATTFAQEGNASALHEVVSSSRQTLKQALLPQVTELASLKGQACIEFRASSSLRAEGTSLRAESTSLKRRCSELEAERAGLRRRVADLEMEEATISSATDGQQQ